MNWYLDVYSLDCMSDDIVADLATIERLEKECSRPDPNDEPLDEAR